MWETPQHSQASSRDQAKSKLSFKTELAVTQFAGPPEFSKVQHLPERFWRKCLWISTPPSHQDQVSTWYTDQSMSCQGAFSSDTCRKTREWGGECHQGWLPESSGSRASKLDWVHFQRVRNVNYSNQDSKQRLSKRSLSVLTPQVSKTNPHRCWIWETGMRTVYHVYHIEQTERGNKSSILPEE